MLGTSYKFHFPPKQILRQIFVQEIYKVVFSETMSITE